MLAIVFLTDNHTESIADQAIAAGLLTFIMILILMLLLAASAVHRIFANTRARVVSRMMGIVLTTMAVDTIPGGFDALGCSALRCH